MSRERFTIVYDGSALQGGVMDVRDLAPALMALGQLLDAANLALNGDDAKLKLQVAATERGSFQISFELIQSWSAHQILDFFGSSRVSGATNLLSWVLGVGSIGQSLIWLAKKLKGSLPDRFEQVAENTIRITTDGESYDIPLELLRLYRDVPVRTALQKLIEEPLKKDGIDSFQVKKDGVLSDMVSKEEAIYFSRPALNDEILLDEIRRFTFSIVSLAFKEDNKWRLSDGQVQIGATINDQSFLEQVDASRISFSKGDILICDVRMVQKRTADGLKTDYIVERVIEHRPAARQLPLPLAKPLPKPDTP